MYNRVDVLCKSWDVSLAVPQGERPADHQDEILAPLREVSMVNGRAVDVIEYEKNVAAWKPVESKVRAPPAACGRVALSVVR